LKYSFSFVVPASLDRIYFDIWSSNSRVR